MGTWEFPYQLGVVSHTIVSTIIIYLGWTLYTITSLKITLNV
jgi:hypothetical protein